MKKVYILTSKLMTGGKVNVRVREFPSGELCQHLQKELKNLIFLTLFVIFESVPIQKLYENTLK
jgi:hypothetical protein